MSQRDVDAFIAQAKTQIETDPDKAYQNCIDAYSMGNKGCKVSFGQIPFVGDTICDGLQEKSDQYCENGANTMRQRQTLER